MIRISFGASICRTTRPSRESAPSYLPPRLLLIEARDLTPLSGCLPPEPTRADSFSQPIPANNGPTEPRIGQERLRRIK